MSHEMIKITVNGIMQDAVIKFSYSPAMNGDEAEYSLEHLSIIISDGSASINTDGLLLDDDIAQTIIDELEEVRGAAHAAKEA